jgi:hypothetical protein
MMPIDFCASFEPCEKAIMQAERSCRRREIRCTSAAARRRKIHVSAIMKKNAAMKPSVGETTSGISTFWTSEPQRNASTPA